MSDTEENKLLSRIFEMVNDKKEQKKPRKKRAPMSDEQKQKAIENLKKGRETSMKNRQAKAKAKKKQPEVKEEEIKEEKVKEQVKEESKQEPEIKSNEQVVENDNVNDEKQPSPPHILKPSIQNTPYSYNSWSNDSLW
ncbi:MAG: hypothetical protein P1U85_21225 [Verrucomicrobiales bacterium]|nr:hypothetical protein [Verrucomicrobiales bacterium]